MTCTDQDINIISCLNEKVSYDYNHDKNRS